MGEKQRIYIVEDHTLLRAGLRSLLSQDPDIEIIGEADNGRDAVRAIGALAPNLVLLDISMPGMNGIDALPHILERAEKARVLILSSNCVEGGPAAIDALANYQNARAQVERLTARAPNGGNQ